MSEQERGRMSAERANAHLAKAESELEAAQRFVDPGGGGESELALARAIASARACVADARETPGMTIDRSPSGSHFYSPECQEFEFSELRIPDPA